MIPAGEAGHAAGTADHGGGDDRANAEDLGDCRPGRLDRAVSFFLVSRIQHHPPMVDQHHVPQQVGHLADEVRGVEHMEHHKTGTR